MTMEAENCRIIFQGNGSTTQFQYPYWFYADSELVVYLHHLTSGEVVELDPVFYSIGHPAGEPPYDGCTITCAPGGDPIASDQALIVTRRTYLNQHTDLDQQQAYFLDSIEDHFDRICRQMQEERDRTKRMPMLSVEDAGSLAAGFHLTLTSPEPGEFIRWAEDGSYTLEGYPLDDFDSQEWIDAWHREYYSQVTEDNIAVEQGWVEPTTANWNALTTPGYYSYIDALNFGMTNTPPNLSSSGMLTVTSSYSNVLQVYVNNADNSKYSRIHYNGTWQAWEPIGGMVDQGVVDIGDGGDVDTLNEVGVYYIVDGAATPPDPVLRALPGVSSATGILSVEETEGQMRQHFSALGLPDTGRSFVRTYYTEEGNWGIWRETTGITEGDLPALVGDIFVDNGVQKNFGRIGNEDDWNDLTEGGFYWYDYTLDLGQLNKPPQVGQNGILATENSSNSVIRQVYTVNISGVPVSAIRAAYLSGGEFQWSSWIELGDSDLAPEWHVEYYSQVAEDKLQVEKSVITNTTQNWNNLTVPGWYTYDSSLNVGMTNTPPNIGVGGMLEVQVTTDLIKQCYTHAYEPVTVCRRTFANGDWTPWKVDSTSEYTPGGPGWVEPDSLPAFMQRGWNVIEFNPYTGWFYFGGDVTSPNYIARTKDGITFEQIIIPDNIKVNAIECVSRYWMEVFGDNAVSPTNKGAWCALSDLTTWYLSEYTGMESYPAISYGLGVIDDSSAIIADSGSDTGRFWYRNGYGDMIDTYVSYTGRKFTGCRGNGTVQVFFGGNATKTVISVRDDRDQPTEKGGTGCPAADAVYGNGRWVVITHAGTVGGSVWTSDDQGDTWTARTPFLMQAETDYDAIAYGNGTFLAVSKSRIGEPEQVVISVDGVNWEAEGTPYPAKWHDVAYGNDIFIAVAEDTNYGNTVMVRRIQEGSVEDISAATVPVDTTLFGNVLSSADDTVQKSLDTLDDHTHPAQLLDVTNFDGILSETDVNVQIAMDTIDDLTHSTYTVDLPDDWEPDQGYDGPGEDPVGQYYWWCGQQFPVTETLTGAAINPDTGRAVVCGFGSYPDLIWYSDDQGETWTSAGAPGDMDVQWSGIAFGNGRFVICAYDSPDHVIAYSDDGANWTVPDTQAGNNSYLAIAFNASNGYFCTIADGGGQDVLYSANGDLWYMATSGIGFTPVDLCFGQGWFYAVGNYGGDMGGFARSSNGAGWFSETTIGAPGTFNAIAANDDVIVAVMQASSTQARYSADGGVNWQSINTSALSSTQQWWQDVTFGDGMFLAVGSRTGYDQIMVSENGVDWSNIEFGCAGISWDSVDYLDKAFLALNRTNGPYNLALYYYWVDEVPQGNYEIDTDTPELPESYPILGSTYGNGRWVVCGRSNYPNLFLYSDDAQDWTAGVYAGQDIGFYDAAYGDGKFLACSYNGVTACIAESADGINWSDVAASSSVINTWYGIDHHDGLWVAVGSGEVTTNIMISTDGINWTLVDLGAIHYLRDVVYWEAGGLWVAVGSTTLVGEDDECILTSPDGATWTLRTDGSLQTRLKGVACNDDTLVAVSDGPGERFLVSYDAIDWYVSYGSVTTGAWTSVAYGDGRFVAISGDPFDGPKIAVSLDSDWGDEWTFTDIPASAAWNKISYGDYNFCITSYSGYPNNVMWYRGSPPPEDMTVDTPFHAAYIEVFTGNFDNNLEYDPPLDTVQKCLDFIDDMDLSEAGGGSSSNASDIVLDGSNLDGNLAGVDLNVQAAIDAIDDLTVGTLAIDTTNFDDILSPAEDTVQKALDVLDDHRHPAARITLTTDDFDGVLGTGQTNVQLAMDVIDDHGHSAGDILPDASGASAGDVLTWDGSDYVWEPPPSIDTITGADIGLDTTNFDGILHATDINVQLAMEVIDDHGHDATDVGTVTSNFDGLFTSAQNTVQKCLDVIDDHSHTLAAADVTVDVTDFDGVLSTADTVLQHALETMDDHAHDIDALMPDQSTANPGDVLVTDGSNVSWVTPEGSAFALNTAKFDGVLSTEDTDVQTAMDTIDDHYHVNNVPRCGFVNRTDSSLPDSMDTSAFFLSGTYEFYVNGILFEDTDGGVDIGSSYGYHYIYYDVDGALQSTEIEPPIDYEHCLVATVMWNGIEGFVIDQRHLSTRNADLAAMMDDTVGARYGDGFDATFTDTTFQIGAGHYWDEDLRYDIPVTTLCRIMHRNGTNWTWTDQQAEYYIADSGVLQYDSSGVLTDVADGSFMAIWVYATGDVLNKIWMLAGQRVDTGIEDARVNNDLPGLALPGSVRDARLLYRVILQQVGTTPTYVETRDYRKANVINGNEIVKGDHLYLENIGTLTHPELEQAIADIVAAGYMNWKGKWVPALYEVGDTVSDDQWTMVAITQTDDRPAPQPVGDLFWVRESVGESAWESGSTTTNVLYLGQRYNFTESYRVSTIRTYHNADAIGLNVEIWAVMSPGTDDERISNILPGRVLEAEDLDTWQQFNIGNLYVEAGSVVDLIKVVRPSTGSVTFTHTWTYEGATGDPTEGRIYHQRGSSLNEMRVHAVDNGGTDRSTELDNIGPGSTITMATSGYIWEVLSASKTGDIYTFIVDPGTSANNSTSDFTFLYIAPIPINYAYATDLFSSSPNVSGYFGSEYLPNEPAYLNENGYGLDIQVQNMTSSDDWDVVAYPPSGSFSTGGGASGGGDAVDIEVDSINFDGILSSTDLNVQQALETIDDHQHTEADITDLDKYTQAQVDTALEGKSDTGHTHTESEVTDLDKYATSEVDTLLAGKADAMHNHPQLVLEIPADGDWSGTAVSMTVAADGGAFALHYVNASGQLEPADADADTTMPGMFMALAAGTGAQNMLVQGFVTNSAWSWTPGAILYASTTAGGLAETAPSGFGDQLQTVGLAITATTMLFKPDLVLAEIGFF